MGTYDTIGGTPRHDPAFDVDYPCEICGKDPVYCICPECPVCKVVGDPKCYKEHGLKKPANPDGYEFIYSHGCFDGGMWFQSIPTKEEVLAKFGDDGRKTMKRLLDKHGIPPVTTEEELDDGRDAGPFTLIEYHDD